MSSLILPLKLCVPIVPPRSPTKASSVIFLNSANSLNVLAAVFSIKVPCGVQLLCSRKIAESLANFWANWLSVMLSKCLKRCVGAPISHIKKCI